MQLLTFFLFLILFSPAEESNKKHPFPCPTSYRTALTYYLDITNPPRTNVLYELAQYSTDAGEQERLRKMASSAADGKVGAVAIPLKLLGSTGCWGIPRRDAELLGTTCRELRVFASRVGKSSVVCPLCSQALYLSWVVEARRNILAILQDMPSLRPPIDHLCELLPRLQARYYSIASSSKVRVLLRGLRLLTGRFSSTVPLSSLFAGYRTQGICTGDTFCEGGSFSYLHA